MKTTLNVNKVVNAHAQCHKYLMTVNFYRVPNIGNDVSYVIVYGWSFAIVIFSS